MYIMNKIEGNFNHTMIHREHQRAYIRHIKRQYLHSRFANNACNNLPQDQEARQ
jgi:hypothetical protein